MELTCSNCEAQLPEDAKYCLHCGQSTKSLRRPFVDFLKESFLELLDIDGRLSMTIRTLLFKPGLASYEFDHGKRNKYTPPLRLYLAVSVVFFLIVSSFHHIFAGGTAYSESAVTMYSRAMFILFPIFALYLKLFFRGSYYLSNLVFSMHIHSVAYLVLTFVGPLEAMEKYHQVFLFLQGPFILFYVWYFFSAFKTMYQESWPITILKVSGVYLVYMASLGVVFDVMLA